MGNAVVMKFWSETSKTVWYNCLSRCQARYLYSSPPFRILIPPKALYSYLFSPAPYCYCAGESYSGLGRAPEECAPWLPFIEEGPDVATLLPPAARPRFCQNMLFISHPTHPEFFAQSRSEDKQIILDN